MCVVPPPGAAEADAAAAKVAAEKLPSKKLTKSESDMHTLYWPFGVWGVLVIALYAVSITNMVQLQREMVLKGQAERMTAHADRVAFFASEVVLGGQVSVLVVPPVRMTVGVWDHWQAHEPVGSSVLRTYPLPQTTASSLMVEYCSAWYARHWAVQQL